MKIKKDFIKGNKKVKIISFENRDVSFKLQIVTNVDFISTYF